LVHDFSAKLFGWCLVFFKVSLLIVEATKTWPVCLSCSVLLMTPGKQNWTLPFDSKG